MPTSAHVLAFAITVFIAAFGALAIIYWNGPASGPWPAVLAQFVIVWLSATLTHRSRVDENPNSDIEYALANAVGIFLVGIGFYIGGIGDSVQWSAGGITFDPTKAEFDGLLAFAEGTIVARSLLPIELPIGGAEVSLALTTFLVGALTVYSILMAYAAYWCMSRQDSADSNQLIDIPVQVCRWYLFVACLMFTIYLFAKDKWTPVGEVGATNYLPFLLLLIIAVFQYLFATRIHQIRASIARSRRPSTDINRPPRPRGPHNTPSLPFVVILISLPLLHIVVTLAIFVAVLLGLGPFISSPWLLVTAAIGIAVGVGYVSTLALNAADALVRRGFDASLQRALEWIAAIIIAVAVGAAIVLFGAVILPFVAIAIALSALAAGGTLAVRAFRAWRSTTRDDKPESKPPKQPDDAAGEDAGEKRRRWLWTIAIVVLILAGAIGAYLASQKATTTEACAQPCSPVAPKSGGPEGKPEAGSAAAGQPTPTAFVIFFDYKSHHLTDAARDIVAKAAAAVKSHKAPVEILVVGHTDTVGSEAYNEALARRRADAVRDALIAAGIPAEWVKAESRGETELPIATADGVKEPQNRRVSITLTIAAPRIASTQPATQ
jgi:outer membrane protein OmpA-like peptidoglycan-associated protein